MSTGHTAGNIKLMSRGVNKLIYRQLASVYKPNFDF